MIHPDPHLLNHLHAIDVPDVRLGPEVQVLGLLEVDPLLLPLRGGGLRQVGHRDDSGWDFIDGDRDSPRRASSKARTKRSSE